MAHERILIVDDDPHVGAIVSQHLTSLGYVCTQTRSGIEAALLLERKSFDLVLTDLMLPDFSGEDLVRLSRLQKSTRPVLVISARTSVADKVELLRLGADDYLSKPFDLDELAARIEVQLRRPEPAESRSTIRFGDWVLDGTARTLVAKGKDIPLTRTEYNMVELLATNPNKIFSKEELYQLAWKEQNTTGDDTVSVHISHIRGKLKESGTDSYIQTVWGMGFRLTDIRE